MYIYVHMRYIDYTLIIMDAGDESTHANIPMSALQLQFQQVREPAMAAIKKFDYLGLIPSLHALMQKTWSTPNFRPMMCKIISPFTVQNPYAPVTIMMPIGDVIEITFGSIVSRIDLLHDPVDKHVEAVRILTRLQQLHKYLQQCAHRASLGIADGFMHNDNTDDAVANAQLQMEAGQAMQPCVGLSREQINHMRRSFRHSSEKALARDGFSRPMQGHNTTPLENGSSACASGKLIPPPPSKCDVPGTEQSTNALVAFCEKFALPVTLPSTVSVPVVSATVPVVPTVPILSADISDRWPG